MSGPQHVVVVGAGLGGLRTVEALRTAEFPGRISLVGDEPHEPYDRPPLSKEILAGRWPEERATLYQGDLRALDVALYLGTAAVGVDPTTVHLDDGTRLGYDHLVIATGVRARRLPGQPDHPELHLLRTLEDCRALRDSMSRARSLLVVGAGFIGAEVAATARAAGLEVTLLEALPVPFARVLGPEMGELCARLQVDNGVRLCCGVGPVELLGGVADGAGGADGVGARLADGAVVRADCAVVGVGTAVDSAWLSGLGVPAESGLVCDETGLVVGTENVSAVGDIAAWPHPVFGDHVRIEHWTSAAEQAMIVGQRISGAEVSTQADAVPYFWSDQYGLKLQLVGRPDRADSVRVLHDPGIDSGTIKGTLAGYFAEDTLVAALAFHSPRLLNRCRRLVRANATLSEVRDTVAEVLSR